MKGRRSFLLLGFVGALAATGAWIAGTTSGLRMLAASALPFLPAHFDPADLEGNLLGRVSVGRIEFSAGGLDGSIEGVQFELRLAALVRGTLHLAELRIVEPRLTWRGADTARDAPAAREQVSLALPVAVQVDLLTVVDGALRSGAAPLVEALNLEASGSLSDRNLQLTRISLQSSRGQLSGSARAALQSGSPWLIQVAWQLELDGTTVAGETRVEGVTERLDVAHSVSTPLVARVTGGVQGLPGAPAWQLALAVEPSPAEPNPWPDVLREFNATLAIVGGLASSTIDGEVELPARIDGKVKVSGRLGWRDGVAILEDLVLGLPDDAVMTAAARVIPGDTPAAEFALQGRGLGWPLGRQDRTVELPTFTLRGKGAGKRWQFDVAGRALRPGLAALDIACSLLLTGPQVEFDRCDLRSPDGEVRGSVRGTLDTARANLPFRIDATTEVEVPDYPRVAATWNAVGDAGGLQVENLTAELLDGRVQGSGRIAWPTGWSGEQSVERTSEPSTHFELDFRDLDPAGIAAEWPGRLSGALQLRGLPGGPDGLEVVLASLRGQLRALPVAGAARFSAVSDAYQLHRARLQVGSATLEAEGRLDPSAVRLDAAIDAPALSALLPDADGKLIATVRVRGNRDAPTIDLEAQGDRLRWAAYRAQALRVAGRVDLSGKRNSHITANVEGFGSGPASDGRDAEVRLAIDGRPAAHEIRLDYEQAQRDQRLAFVAEGRAKDERWIGSIRKLSVAQADRQLWNLQAPASVTARAAAISLREACLDGVFGTLCLHGDWFRGGTVSGWATLAGIDLAPVTEWLSDSVRVQGSLSGRVDVAADAGAFRNLSGKLILSAGDLRLAQASSSPLLAWDGGLLELAGGPLEALATVGVDLSGSDRIDGRLAVGWNASAPPLRGEFDGELGQLQWLTEIVPDIADLEGRAILRAEVSGTFDAPSLNGRFEWRDGTAHIPELGLRPSGLGVIAELTGGLLEFTAMGSSGDGTFRSEGRFELGAGALVGQATLSGRDLLVASLPEARVVANPDLRMRFAERAITVEGAVEVPFARLSGGGRPAVVGVSRDEVLVGPLARDEAPGLAVSSRVRVTAGQDVRVRTAGLRGTIEGGVLTAIQPDAPPWGRGELRVKDGTFTAFGQQLEIERGRLIFTGGPLDNPGLEIRTVRRIGGVTAGAQVRGTLQQPEVSVFSEPPMPRAEALAYLTFGRGLQDLQSSERGAINQAAASLAVTGGGAVVRDMGRRLGLNDAEVSVEGDSDGASLVMGRYLGGGLYVSYGLGLFDTVNTLRLRLRINSRLALEATSGEAATADLIHTIERD